MGCLCGFLPDKSVADEVGNIADAVDNLADTVGNIADGVSNQIVGYPIAGG